MAAIVMVLELMGVLIRPMSLGLRMVANITAGHCIMAIFGQAIVAIRFTSITGAILIIAIYSVYYILEIGVAIIQAYIFVTLIALYSGDHR